VPYPAQHAPPYITPPPNLPCAGKTLRDNLTILGPHVLPLREQWKVLLSMARRRGAAEANRLADRFGVARLPFAKSGRYERPAIYVSLLL
jgi:hypothetical protein